MAAAAPLIAVPRNLYKHFAVLTVAITVCVAVFADGENKQAIAEKIEQRQEARVKRAQAERAASQQNVAGLRDNRGHVVNGNNDVGAPPPVGLTIVPVLNEVGEPTLAAAVRRQAQRKPVRKSLAVLPPGLPASPGMQADPPPKLAVPPPL
jgi:hypothetical protein